MKSTQENIISAAKEKKKISIGITSTGYLALQQKWITEAIAELHAKNPSAKVLVISLYQETGYFKKYAEASVQQGKLLCYSDVLHFLNWNTTIQQNDTSFIMTLINAYDAVYWDLPEVEYIRKWGKKLVPLFKFIHELKFYLIGM